MSEWLIFPTVEKTKINHKYKQKGKVHVLPGESRNSEMRVRDSLTIHFMDRYKVRDFAGFMPQSIVIK